MKYILLFTLCVVAMPSHASDLDASLDRYEPSIPVNPPTVFSATLHNTGKSRLYITGIEASLSDNAFANVYNPVLLHEELHQLDAGQTWDGPLVVVTPKRRGPLWISGSILIKGGAVSSSTETLAAIPLHLTVDDPKRAMDGSMNRGIVPACDYPSDRCCDPGQTLCFETADKCIYVADGFNHQKVCIDGDGQTLYDHISDLKVSSDAAHVAYLAKLHCTTWNLEERCDEVVVIDGVEHPEMDRHGAKAWPAWYR